MPHNLELTDPTFSRLQRLAVPLVDTIETVIVRLADYWDNGHGKPVPPTGDELEEADQLPQKAFRVPLIEALYELGGRAKSHQVVDLVGRKVAPLLGPADRKLRPDGKLKWENLVHWNRFNLVKEGLFKKDSGHDVWELSDEGIKYAEGIIASKIDSERPKDNGSAVRNFDATSVPSLTYTKLLSAKVGGKSIRPMWNGLLIHMIRLIPKGRLANIEEARRLIIINFVAGRKENEGFRFLPELGISVQGQDADDSWKGASHIAQKLGVPIEVEFLWRMKEGAAFPGVTGRLSV